MELKFIRVKIHVVLGGVDAFGTNEGGIVGKASSSAFFRQYVLHCRGDVIIVWDDDEAYGGERSMVHGQTRDVMACIMVIQA